VTIFSNVQGSVLSCTGDFADVQYQAVTAPVTSPENICRIAGLMEFSDIAPFLILYFCFLNLSEGCASSVPTHSQLPFLEVLLWTIRSVKTPQQHLSQLNILCTTLVNHTTPK